MKKKLLGGSKVPEYEEMLDSNNKAANASKKFRKN